MVGWLGRLKKLMLISTPVEVVVDLYVVVVEAPYFIGWVAGWVAGSNENMTISTQVKVGVEVGSFGSILLNIFAENSAKIFNLIFEPFP